MLRRAKEAGMDCLDNPLAYVTLHKVDLGFNFLDALASLDLKLSVSQSVSH